MSGQMAGADVLFAEHRDGVFRYLCRFVGQAETARDLTQEVFLRVSRSGAPEGAVGGDSAGQGHRAWIFTIARNLALNHVRDVRRQPATSEASAFTDASRPATQELAASLNQALAALSDLDRDVFLLRETAGLSYDEIATACALTPDAVRSRLHRARQQLREMLGRSLAAEQRHGIRLGRTP
jgi:RNA polymerase sigma-70 factor, ECF subfamily